jgi:hypothetical protein
MVNSEELIGTVKYVLIRARYRLKRCRYKRARLYVKCQQMFHYGLPGRHW